MKLKSIVAAVAVAATLATGASTALAATSTLTFIGNTASFGSNVSGSFSDTYNFSLSEDSFAGVSATSVALKFTGFDVGAITSFAAMLDGNALTSTTSSFAGVGFTGLVSLLAGGKTLASGSHALVVSGFAPDGASYGGNVTISPVPEPETYAMLLAGLGLIGAIARRRNGKADS